jgi:hypothetical protein
MHGWSMAGFFLVQRPSLLYTSISACREHCMHVVLRVVVFVQVLFFMRNTSHMWILVPCVTWDPGRQRGGISTGHYGLLDQSLVQRRLGDCYCYCTQRWFLISNGSN